MHLELLCGAWCLNFNRGDMIFYMQCRLLTCQTCTGTCCCRLRFLHKVVMTDLLIVIYEILMNEKLIDKINEML